MKQQTHRRLFILLVAGVIMAMVWLFVGLGLRRTPTTTPPDRVRRMATAVWAGSPGNNPPLLNNGNWKDLNTNDSVRTDQFGEAELELDGCNGSVWVFDNSTLSVWTCTKQAESDNELWCTEEGTAGFNIDCAARFVVDTPSALVTIQGTAFTVTYLPDKPAHVGDRPQRGSGGSARAQHGHPANWASRCLSRRASSSIPCPASFLPRLARSLPANLAPWTSCRSSSTTLASVAGWMTLPAGGTGSRSCRRTGPFEPEQVTLAFDGGQLMDPRVQEAFVAAIDKEPVMGQRLSRSGRPAHRAHRRRACRCLYHPLRPRHGPGHARRGRLRSGAASHHPLSRGG